MTHNDGAEEWFSGIPYTGGAFQIGFDPSAGQPWRPQSASLSINEAGNTTLGGILSIPGFSNVSASLAAGGAGDNLGNHTATQALNMSNQNINNINQLDVDGTSNFADHITVVEGKKIFFDSTDTFIGSNTNATEDLLLAADDDIILSPDDDVIIQSGSTSYAIFDGSLKRFGIGDTTPESTVHIEHTDTTTNAITNTYADYLLALRNNTNTTNAFAGIAFDVSTETDLNSIGAAIKGVRASDAGGNSTLHDTHLTFHTNTISDDDLAERMRITNAGDVLIGTTTSAVTGLTVDNHISGGNGLYIAQVPNANNGNIALYNTNTGQFTYQHSSSFASGGVNDLNYVNKVRITVINSLNTEIDDDGGGTAGFKFTEGPNIAISGSNSGTDPQIKFSFQPGGVNAGVYFNNNSSTVMGTPVAEFTFDETGNDELRVAGDIIAYETTSDKRLKNNIKPLSNSLKKIIQIGGYEFDWNENQNTYSGHDVGIIAQEIEEVLPEAVETRANGYKAVQYKKIIPLLIEGMKDQQKQIDELKELVNKLIEKDANNS